MSAFTLEQVTEIVNQGLVLANEAQKKYLDENLNGIDQFACGFAWTIIEVKGSTKLGKMLKSLNFDKPYGKTGLQYWMPGRLGVQNIDCNYQGAKVFAKHLSEKLGISCYADSCLD